MKARLLTYIYFAKRIMLLSLLLTVVGNASAQSRLALVIGNSDYGSGHALINPRNDALAIAKKLNSIGYTVHTGQALLDLNLEKYNDSVVDFLASVEDGSSVLVYYAGHGSSSLGSNYLIPILPSGVKLRSESDIRNHSVSIEGLLERVEYKNPTGVNVFFFDACRDAPIESISRSINMTGLTELNSRRQPHGSFIGFSTEYGSIATDGAADRHSPFAAAMLSNLDSRANLPIELFYKSVGDDVFNATNGNQFPIQEPKIRGEYCLVDCLNTVALSKSNPTDLGYFDLFTTPAETQVCYRVDGEWDDWRCGNNVQLPIGKTVSVKATAAKHKQYTGTVQLNSPYQKLVIELDRKNNFVLKAVGIAAAVVVTGLLVSQKDSQDDDGYTITLELPPQ